MLSSGLRLLKTNGEYSHAPEVRRFDSAVRNATKWYVATHSKEVEPSIETMNSLREDYADSFSMLLSMQNRWRKNAIEDIEQRIKIAIAERGAANFFARGSNSGIPPFNDGTISLPETLPSPYANDDPDHQPYLENTQHT